MRNDSEEWLILRQYNKETNSLESIEIIIKYKSGNEELKLLAFGCREDLLLEYVRRYPDIVGQLFDRLMGSSIKTEIFCPFVSDKYIKTKFKEFCVSFIKDFNRKNNFDI